MQTYVAGAATATTLSSNLNNSATSFSVVAVTGWPASVPFVIAIDRGTVNEEKILVTARSGTSITACTRGYDSTTAVAHSVGTNNVEHVISAAQIQELIDHVNELAGGIDHTVNGIADGAVTPAKLSSKTITVPVTFTVAGPVAVAVGDVDYINGFFVPVPSGQTAKLVAARYRINSGTSVQFDIEVNGSDATGFANLTASTTSTTTDPADVTLANNDYVTITVDSVTGSPKNLSVTLWIAYTLA